MHERADVEEDTSHVKKLKLGRVLRGHYDYIRDRVQGFPRQLPSDIL